MRKIVQRIAAVLVILSLLGAPVAGAAGLNYDRLTSGQLAAEELYELGLFRGNGTLPDGSPDFNLEDEPTRTEAIIMLVRLLGAEAEAEAVRYAHPFTDTAWWADAYVGYAYAEGITTGTSASGTLFGAESNITQEQFLTLVLRAMDYTEVDWRDPYPTADGVGLLYPAQGEFYRADMAIICRSALDCLVKGSGQTLLQKLEREGVFRPSGTAAAGYSQTPGPANEAITQVTAASSAGFIGSMAAAVAGRAETIEIHVPAGQEETYNGYLKAEFDALSDAQRISVSWVPRSGRMTASLTYNDAAEIMAWLEGKRESISAEDVKTLNAAKRVHYALVKTGMSEYEQVKAFHDYLVNFNTYRDTGERSHSAAGALVDGYTVCDGYSMAFDLLCYLSGIDCIRVIGKANGGGHAWNLVELDGNWYHVDVTWDDPTGGRPTLQYDYFLISDSAMARDHQWVDYDHNPDAPVNYTR